ncbi:hypothetical protein FPOAC2_03654 [Fusarium poae]|uniref:hypothetical protein n=1 Tax=Fusarium poae TaxID=36050 RepID=UPI001CEA3708|nr:hypothetical protein FPOAC1_003451 [Fusarium poae]KAG8677434.1 hypothetical protein FPOAC1_003451 [Fusarium poae]
MPRRQKPSRGLKTFHRFPQLPLEIQDEIWKLAFENVVPNAHIVNFTEEYNPDGTTHWCLQRLDATGYSSRRDKPLYHTRQDLMLTCRRSWLIIGKIVNKLTWEYEDPRGTWSPTVVREGQYWLFHSEGPMNIATVHQRIYTSYELVIISNPWTSIFTHAGLPSGNIPVKYAAFPYQPNLGLWSNTEAALSRTLRIFNDLKILYILLDSDNIRKGKIGKGKPRKRQQLEDKGLYPAMQEHLRNHKRTPGETSPAIFVYKDRIYREISDVMLLKLNKLARLPYRLEGLERIARFERAKNGQVRPPLIIRLMTW